MKINTAMKKYTIGLAFTLGVLLSAPASAATFTSCVGADYDISTKVEGAGDCTISDEGGVDTETVVNSLPGFFNITDWIFGGKLGADTGYGGTGDGDPDDDGSIGGQSGTYAITAIGAATWQNIMLVFKDGNDTTLVGYLLNSGVLSGDWLTPFLNPPFVDANGTPKDTSHISVYYTECTGECSGPEPIPLPAGILLLISALGGLGFLTRFRKANVAA